MIQFESDKLQNNLGITTEKKQQEPQEKKFKNFTLKTSNLNKI